MALIELRNVEKAFEYRGGQTFALRQITFDIESGEFVTIMGPSGAGKSTLLNALTDAGVFVEDRLFATLDTSTRRLRFPSEREVIITDTVGFLRDLPKGLVGAFKATLEEANQATLLVGSWLRKEQPLLNHRVRQSQIDGGSVMAINPVARAHLLSPPDVPSASRADVRSLPCALTSPLRRG